MKLSTLPILASLLLAGTSAYAGCPEGTQLYARGWSIPVNTSGQLAHAQIWNRSTDQPIYLQQVSVGSNGATDFSILVTPNRLTYDITHYGAGDAGLLSGSGAVSTAGEIRGAINQGVLGGVIVNAQVPVSGTAVFNFDGLVIPPGRGVMIRLGYPNQSLRLSFSACE